MTEAERRCGRTRWCSRWCAGWPAPSICRACSFVAIEPDGGARLVAEAGQSRARRGAATVPLELGEHPEIAEALRLRLPAGRPDGAGDGAAARCAGGRVHGVLELVRCDGGPALTAAQLQYAEQLAEAAIRALEPAVAHAANGSPEAARPAAAAGRRSSAGCRRSSSGRGATR